MLKSVYKISKMDCPSEERLIRMKLEGIPEIKQLEFDIANRLLSVIMTDENPEIEARLSSLDLGSKHRETMIYSFQQSTENPTVQFKLLWTVLLINFGFFLIEIIAGLISGSMGLVADSLDMLADAFVYGLSLWAVGSFIQRKQKVAAWSGYLQLLLALIGMVEVVRRFFGTDAFPDYRTMIVVSVFALLANAVCLYLLQKSKSTEAHMKASMIFTSNDIILNAGVIFAGLLVLFTNSKYPDLIIGSLVFLIVLRGAIRILKLSK
jgi:Co/Zn/Cd efflux system component